MNWTRNFSWIEIALIGAFLLIYLWYYIKVKFVSRALGKNSRIIALKFILRASYLSLLIVSLLGPRFGKTETEQRVAGKDIVLAIDMSKSMNTSDVFPSRLEKAKIELINVISKLRANRFGLLVFSTQAYWQIPFTYDQNVVKDYIGLLQTEMMPKPGSNIAAALELINSKTSDSTLARSKVAIIITDGEDYGQISPELIEKVLKSKLKILLLGIGTTEGQTDLTSQTNSYLNKNYLDQLAKQLKSKSFYLDNSQNQIEDLVKEINSINVFLPQQTRMRAESNKYFNFLIAAFILALADILLTVKIFKI